MTRSKSEHPQLEPLEARSLLSGATAQAIVARASGHVEVRQVQSRDSGNSLPASDVQAMQHDASVNNLEIFLAQVAVLKAQGAGVRQYAAMLLDEHTETGNMLEELAMEKDVLLPGEIQPQEQAAARLVLAAVNTGNFDRVYLTTMVRTHAQLIAGATQQAQRTQDPDFKAFLQAALPVTRSHLAAAQALLAGRNPGSLGSGVRSGIVAGPGGSQLNVNDLRSLEQSYSGSQLDKFLSQLAVLKDNRADVQQYGKKLVNDHTEDNRELEMIAERGNVTLPAGIQGMDRATALGVLASVNTGNFDRTYLSTMVQAHTMDILLNQRIIATTRDPNFMEYAEDDIPTDQFHLGGAKLLLRRSRR